MSSDVKIPEWAEKAADEILGVGWGREMQGVRAAMRKDAILALLAAEQRGRKAGLEEAAAQLLDEIDIYQTLKRSGLRRRADVAKCIAAAIRSLGEKI